MAIDDILTSDPVTKYREKINEMLDVVNASASFQSGTFGSRPAANAVPAGTVYFATDRGDVAVSDHASWRTLTPAAFCAVSAFGGVAPLAANGAAWSLVPNATEVFDLGGHHTSTPSCFTAPVHGLYRCRVTVGMLQAATKSMYATICTDDDHDHILDNILDVVTEEMQIQVIAPAGGAYVSRTLEWVSEFSAGDSFYTALAQDDVNPRSANSSLEVVMLTQLP